MPPGLHHPTQVQLLRRHGRKVWPACLRAVGGMERRMPRPTLPSPEDDAILCRCSCSEGSEAYCASS